MNALCENDNMKELTLSILIFTSSYVFQCYEGADSCITYNFQVHT